MKAKLTQALISRTTASPGKRLELWDTVLPGLFIVVGEQAKTYCVRYQVPGGPRRKKKLGSAEVLTVAEAREMAREVLVAVSRGEDPAAPKPSEGITLGQLLEDHYYPWISANLKTAREIQRSMEATFAAFFATPIQALTVPAHEKELARWREKGNKGVTLNRKLVYLKTALNWAVKQGILEQNPLSKLARRPERDSTPKLRYLTIEEEARLYDVLRSRDTALREARQNHITWCLERKVDPPPPLSGAYADHLEPMITVSLKTGIRRGALFGLEWRDVDFEHRVLVIRGEICKTGKGRVVPLSETALETLRKWEEQSRGEGLIFPSPRTGKRMNNVDSSWERVLREADIKGFRWHDLRHTFASRLVMKGIDLNVVRELLGHSDLKMTLRYAHLAPNVKSQAVELLG